MAKAIVLGVATVAARTIAVRIGHGPSLLDLLVVACCMILIMSSPRWLVLDARGDWHDLVSALRQSHRARRAAFLVVFHRTSPLVHGAFLLLTASVGMSLWSEIRQDIAAVAIGAALLGPLLICMYVMMRRTSAASRASTTAPLLALQLGFAGAHLSLAPFELAGGRIEQMHRMGLEHADDPRVFLFSLLIGLLGLFLVFESFSGAHRAFRTDREIRRARDAFRDEVAEGRGWLRVMRYGMGSTASILGALVAASWLVGTWSYLSWITGGVGGESIELAQRSARHWLTRSQTSRAIDIGIIAVWALVLLPWPCLLLTSVWSYSKEMHDLTRRIVTEKHDDPATRRTRRIIGELCRAANMEEPQLAALADAPGSLMAIARSAWDRRGIIAIDRDVLGALSEGRLKALLAHELAHLRRGDCRKVSKARYFCRCIVPCGDAIAVAWEDSLRFEREADDEAINPDGPFRASPGDLADAIELLDRERRRARAAKRYSQLGLGSLQAVGDDTELESKKCGGVVAQGWRSLTILFSGGTGISYWHPGLNERVQRLRAIEMRKRSALAVHSSSDPARVRRGGLLE